MFAFLLIIVICGWALYGMLSEVQYTKIDGFDIIIIMVLCIVILLFGCAIISV